MSTTLQAPPSGRRRLILDTIDSPTALALRLRETREARKMSQRQLSFPGCTAAYISRIEAADRVPSLQLIRELAALLGVSWQWLATGTEPAADEQDDLVAVLQARIGQLEQQIATIAEIAKS